MRKMRTADVWGLAIVGVFFAGVVIALVAMSASFFSSEGVTYTLDLTQIRDKPTWTTSMDPQLKASLAVERDAGVVCELPTDGTFRGVLLRGRELHGRVLQYRMFPDRYYIEFRDGTVRCVTDTAPWGPVSAQVRDHVAPQLIQILVDDAVLAPS